MTDKDLISRSLDVLGEGGREVFLLQRGGRVLLALPAEKEAALIALSLYQPQRRLAKIFVVGVRVAIRLGLMPFALKRISLKSVTDLPREKDENMPQVVKGTAGVLLGNPDHVIRRAIVSFQARDGFEVAKMAFGKEGVALMEGEAATIESLPKGAVGIPEILGTHHAAEIGVMRMPYLRGEALGTDDPESSLTLLRAWLLEEEARALPSFAEWSKIEAVLSGQPKGKDVLDRLKSLKVKPAIRHGDFAPWNLIRDQDAKVLALDWEWGVARGVSGFDLIHYLTQELRLVQRLPEREIVVSVRATLQSEPFSNYLRAAGWQDAPNELFIAAIAFGVSLGLDGVEDLLELLLSA